RLKLIEIADKFQIPIIEDSPYRELCYNNNKVPSLWTLANGKGIIQVKTLSKILFPGMRIGWIVAQNDIINKFSMMKQSVDLCSPTINQLIIARYMQEGLMKDTIERAIALYREKNKCMVNALRKYMPEGVTWSEPSGGVFLWVKLPEHMDAKDLIEQAAENKVIYVTGKPFHCDGSGRNTLRLNYSFPSMEQIETGISRLAETIKKFS
ncbi:MAG: aminotransferase, partial [Marinilabiliales bacterium]